MAEPRVVEFDELLSDSMDLDFLEVASVEALSPPTQSSDESLEDILPSTETLSSRNSGITAMTFDPTDDIGTEGRSELLHVAAVVARDRRPYLGKSCQKTATVNNLIRDDTMPWQCTRSCGKRFSKNKNWVRHEELAFPQKGYLCLVGGTIQDSDGKTGCSFCPLGSETTTPSLQHTEKMHLKPFQRCISGRTNKRKGAFYRYQHFVHHYKRIHPYPHAWSDHPFPF